MVEITHLKKFYDGKQALHIPELRVEENHILGLVGTNGSGKSTLLRLIAGVLEQEEGEITIDGVSVKKNPEAKANLLYISDDPVNHVNTSVETVFDFYSIFYGMEKQTFFRWLDFFEIPHKGNLSKFSKGMRRRTYLAVALAVQPKILLLDEAFDGLDPTGKKLFAQAIRQVTEQNDMTVIVASHSLRELEDLCDSYLMLKKGEIVTYAADGLYTDEYTKVTLAFRDAFDFSALASDKITMVSHLDRICTLYYAGPEREAREYLEAFHPAVAEYSSLTAEEYFILKTEE